MEHVGTIIRNNPDGDRLHVPLITSRPLRLGRNGSPRPRVDDTMFRLRDWRLSHTLELVGSDGPAFVRRGYIIPLRVLTEPDSAHDVAQSPRVDGF